jgi:pyruvate,water dikinase
MVPSDVSGVLFTANPLTGRRTEMVIDATFGLGEALVSGQVEPDHYVVDVVEVATAAAIVDKRLGAKALAIMSQAGGGIERVSVAEGERPAISDEIVLELVSLGGRVAELFGAAQDIEWTLSEGVIYLLQSRPITSLYPLSNGITVSDEQGLRVLFSFGAIQGMLDPMTPLGRDAIKGLFAGGGRIFGYQLTPQSQRVILAAGERLYVDMTSPLRHTIGQKMVGNSMGLVEPGTAAALEEFLSETRLTRSARIRPRTVWRLLKFLAPTAARLLLAMIRPDRRRAKIQNRIERTYLQHESQFEAANTLSSRLACFEGMLDEAFPSVFPDFLPAIAGGMMSLNALKRISAHLGLSGDEALMITRGMPYNVTTEMDLALWATASAIKADREAAAYFAAADASEASADFLQGRLPEAGQSALESFMQRYGMRGTAEIDLGRARWREEPLPVMRSLQSYLGIEEADLAPDVVFERGMLAAAAAESRIIEAMMKTRFGRPKALLVHFFSDRMRALAGLRESPKFLIMRLMGIAREALLASGQELVGQEILEEADDIFFLDLTELRELAKGDTVPGRDARAWRQLVATRRGDYQRERRRRQIPRLMLSDGRSYYEGIAASGAENGDNLVGSPVSPGVVEGIVRVVFDPAQAGLRPGEILVCPGTDPAWTPLFLAAGGLVTEVGGLMTHGSVVAREYGIPAVVGVYEATKRLKTGQKVRIDGGTGVIVNCEL